MKKRILPTRTLPERPNLDQLRRQAKELQRRRPGSALHEAQFELARSYGFDSWPKLKAFVDGVTVRRLADAVRAGDLRRVRAMLKARPEIVNFDMAENNEHRAMHYAVFARNAAMVRLLMSSGADARAGIYPHRPATTPLTIARERGYGEIVAIIEEEEARRPEPVPERFQEEPQTEAEAAMERGDVEWVRQHWRESDHLLSLAVKHDRPEILRMLLDLGLDPNERNRLENLEEVVESAGQPLWTCADEGKIEMARMLLERGADPNVHVYAGGPAMHRAFARKDAAMIELLEQFGGVVPPVTVGLERDRALARRMLDEEAAGRRLPAGILEGRNVSEDLLRGSADSGDVEIVRMSLPGVDWERSDDRWYWILLQAVWSGNPEVLRLVAERCDVTMRHPRFGRTILHDVAALGGENVAAMSGEMAAILLNAGARMDSRDEVLLSTPLGWACRWGRVEMVRVLLARGADPVESEAEEWARPRAWAEKRRHAAVLELLP